MARITVEDCLDKVPNRFELVLLAAKRAAQLAIGGAQCLVPEENDKVTVLALREIAEGLVDMNLLTEQKKPEVGELFARAAAGFAAETASQKTIENAKEIELATTQTAVESTGADSEDKSPEE